jgi:hypothetical protein
MSTEPGLESLSAESIFERIAKGDADLLRRHSEQFRSQVESEAQAIREGAIHRLISGAGFAQPVPTALRRVNGAE